MLPKTSPAQSKPQPQPQAAQPAPPAAKAGKPPTGLSVAQQGSRDNLRRPSSGFQKRVNGGAGGSDSYVQGQMDSLARQNKQLRQKVEQLERENKELRQSLYNLSLLHGQAVLKIDKSRKDGHVSAVFDLKQALQASPRSNDKPERPSSAISGGDMKDDYVTAAAGSSAKGAASVTKPLQTGRVFSRKFDFGGHTGSVYTIRFAPHGRLLASGSFDKTIRLWDTDKGKGEVACLADHQMNVSDLCWSPTGGVLISGAFDNTVKVWDVADYKLLQTMEVTGFVQSVVIDPTNEQLFYVGTTHKTILCFDRRTPPKATAVLENDSMVNSVTIVSGGNLLLSGDSHGCLKTWSLGEGKVIRTVINERAKKPISYVEATVVRESYADQLVAVNSYDNILRVYDSDNLISPSSPLTDGTCPPLYEAEGHKNKSWPIRSSVYVGRYASVQRREPTANSSDLSSPADLYNRSDTEEALSGMDDDAWTGAPPAFTPPLAVSAESSVLLASGSADNYAYIYDISGVPGAAPLMQRLEGHKDRVYAVTFHPSLPVLASCSADFTVKIWAPKGVY